MDCFLKPEIKLKYSLLFNSLFFLFDSLSDNTDWIRRCDFARSNSFLKWSVSSILRLIDFSRKEFLAIRPFMVSLILFLELMLFFCLIDSSLIPDKHSWTLQLISFPKVTSFSFGVLSSSSCLEYFMCSHKRDKTLFANLMFS